MIQFARNSTSHTFPRFCFIFLLLCFFVTTSFVAPAVAQKKGKKNVNEELNKLVNEVDKKNSKSDPQVGDQEVRIFLDKIEVLGQIDRPQAVYVVLGSDPRVDDIGLDRSFFKEIFRPVDKASVQKAVTRRSTDYIPWE